MNVLVLILMSRGSVEVMFLFSPEASQDYVWLSKHEQPPGTNPSGWTKKKGDTQMKEPKETKPVIATSFTVALPAKRSIVRIIAN